MGREKGKGTESVKQNSGPTQAEKNSKVTNLGTQNLWSALFLKTGRKLYITEFSENVKLTA